MWSRVLPFCALAFWLWYWLVQKVLGPFASDEFFFLHMFWLIRQGKEQYLDFYSYHLPTYFALISPLLPSGDNLNFAWAFRILGVAIVAGYAAMVRPILWPFMLMFVVFARMAEVRPDTIGLLLFNAAWLLLLRKGPHILLAAALSGLALLFSARAPIMMAGMAPLLLWLARKEMATVGWLIGLGVVFLAGIGICWLADPQWFELMVRSVFIDTSSNFERMPLLNRFWGIERAVLAAMLGIALVAGVVALRQNRRDHVALVIAAGSATQIMLLLADPLPNGYAYGWAMLPAVAGIGLAAKQLNREWALPGASAALASAVVVLAGSYYLRIGQPPIGHYTRLTLSTPIADLDRASTPQLASFLLKPADPQTQLRTREVLCSRIRGQSASYFWYQPVCLNDAMPQKWIGQFVTDAEKSEVLKARPPQLIVWGDKRAWRNLNGYSVYPGFALRN